MGERGGIGMMPFMGFECLGDVFEANYKRIYSGGVDLGPLVAHLVQMLGQLADAGMITNMTKKYMEIFLTKDISLSKIEIISRNTNNIVLVNTDIHETESFDLVEYITWITDALCKDPLMKKSLCGRENYEGVKKVLNSYADKELNSMMKEDWVDFYISEEKVFFTKKEPDGIHLYTQNNKYEIKKCLSCSGDDIRHKSVQLARENLLDGRIYHLDDGTVFLETNCGYILRIRCFKDGRYVYSKMEGSIIDQMDDGSLLLMDDGILFRLKSNGRKLKLVDNAFLGMTCIEGNNVYWKSRFRQKDLEANRQDFDNSHLYDKVKESFKSQKYNKEILWKALLFTLYNFDNMEFDNKIGNRLRFAHFYDKLPIPFTMDEITGRLSEMEQYCYSRDIAKTAGYAEAMSYLMSIENKDLDEKQTFEALIYLLDNVADNPYEMIVTDSDTKVMTCLDFFFGDIDHISEESTIDDEMFYSDFDGNIDEMIKRIDQKIAELEEEERKEKEVADVIEVPAGE